MWAVTVMAHPKSIRLRAVSGELYFYVDIAAMSTLAIEHKF